MLCHLHLEICQSVSLHQSIKFEHDFGMMASIIVNLDDTLTATIVTVIIESLSNDDGDPRGNA